MTHLYRRFKFPIEFLCDATQISGHEKTFTSTEIGCAMTRTEWDFDTTIDNDARDVLRPKSREEMADQFGIRSALLVFCIAFFIAAIWFVSRPSFEKCSAVENLTDRNACYEGLRKELLKPPAKGADIPRG
jgi:hypothetical protein